MEPLANVPATVSRLRERDNFFEDVAPGIRAFVDRLIEAGAVKGEPAVALALVRELASYSRLSDTIMVARLAKVTGQRLTHTAAALRHFHDVGAIVYQGGRPGRAGWVSLRPEGVPRQPPLMRAHPGDAVGSPTGDLLRSPAGDAVGSPSEKLVREVNSEKTAADAAVENFEDAEGVQDDVDWMADEFLRVFGRRTVPIADADRRRRLRTVIQRVGRSEVSGLLTLRREIPDAPTVYSIAYFLERLEELAAGGPAQEAIGGRPQRVPERPRRVTATRPREPEPMSNETRQLVEAFNARGASFQ